MLLFLLLLLLLVWLLLLLHARRPSVLEARVAHRCGPGGAGGEGALLGPRGVPAPAQAQLQLLPDLGLAVERNENKRSLQSVEDNEKIFEY